MEFSEGILNRLKIFIFPSSPPTTTTKGNYSVDVRKMQQKVRKKPQTPTPVNTCCIFLTVQGAEKRVNISVYFLYEFSCNFNCSGSCSVKFQNNNSLSVQVKRRTTMWPSFQYGFNAAPYLWFLTLQILTVERRFCCFIGTQYFCDHYV